MTASRRPDFGFALPRPHRIVLSLFLLFSFAASAAAETVYTLQVNATFTNGCPLVDPADGGVDPGANIFGTIRFRVDEDGGTSAPDLTVLAGSSFSVGPHNVPMEVSLGASTFGTSSDTIRLQINLGPDPDTLICGVPASTYRLDFYLIDEQPFNLNFVDNLTSLPTRFQPNSVLTMFHNPPNYSVAITNVSVSETETPEAQRIVDSDGTLLGARNVQVGTTVYDVAFVEGTCADVYGNCAPGSTPSIIDSEAQADAAIYALLEQVFVAPYTNVPSLINGCEDPDLCEVLFPLVITGSQAGRRARVRTSGDDLNSFTGFSSDSSIWTTRVWARFCVAGTGCAPVVGTGQQNGIVGAWYNVFTPDPVLQDAGGPVLLNLLDNGQFMFGEDGDTMADPNGQDGVEWGYYSFDGTTLHFDTRLDTNGEWGTGSDSIPAVLDGNTLTLDGTFVLNRVDSDGLVGGWLANGIVDDESVSLAFMADGDFMLLHGNNPGDPNGQAGIEFGSYVYDDVTGDVTFTLVTDTNGQFGVSDPQGPWGLGVAGDVLTLLEDGVALVTFSRILAGDADGDGVLNVMDNCLEANNADQNDSNGDGFGNLCDTDLNGDCSTNAIDLGLLKLVFFSADVDADFNGDGAVNAIDLGIVKSRFFGAPGPSYQTLLCRGLTR